MTDFEVPAGLVRIVDRDLKQAVIALRDEPGRSLDVHTLRTTFGTLPAGPRHAPSARSSR